METTITITFILALVAYFLPTIVAMARDTDNATAVMLINMFFGWMVIGWFVALVMAGSGNPNATKRRQQEALKRKQERQQQQTQQTQKVENKLSDDERAQLKAELKKEIMAELKEAA
jgi:uncharacterized protein YlxW (UPF0749 family)